MHLIVDQSVLPSLKESLRKAYPGTKPTHRIEAAAKGLGFNTYAGFRAAVNSGPVQVAVDDSAFCSCLNVPRTTENGGAVRSLSHAVVQAVLRPVLDKHPNLTERGFDSVWQGNPNELRKPLEEREMMFASRRRGAYEGRWPTDQFELALIYLSRQKKIKSLNRKIGSYGLKHRAEDLSRKFGQFTHLGDYVSNGMLIAAAYVAGFDVRRVDYNSYNAFINISMQTLKSGGRGITAGHLYQSVFVLRDGDRRGPSGRKQGGGED